MSENESAKGHRFIRRFTILHRGIAAAANTEKIFYVNNDIAAGSATAAEGIHPEVGYFWKVVNGHTTVYVSGAAATAEVEIQMVDLRAGGYYISYPFYRNYSAKATGTYIYGIPSSFVVDEAGIMKNEPIWETDMRMRVHNTAAGALSIVTWDVTLIIEEYMEEWLARKFARKLQN